MNERPQILRRLTISAAMLAAVIVFGSFGYVELEGYGWFDSLYAVVTTITTIGGGEIRPYHLGGKVWTMVVVAVGFIVFTDTLLTLVGFVVEGHLRHAFVEGRMRRRLTAMRDHFILCGFGRIGREIASEFAAEGVAFVVVDLDEATLALAASEGHTVMRGNAAEIDTLKRAGVERARGLVTAVDSDADNVYVTLTARVLRPDLFIVARMNALDAEPKLRLAGANRVASPYVIGGRRLASLAMRPTAVDFVDTVLSAKNAQLLLEDYTIDGGSRWVGRTIAEIAAAESQAIVLALKRGDEMMFRPGADTQIHAGDELVLAGPAQAIRALEGHLG